ncbi:glycoside hydrolase family 32 protein [Kribbella sp. NPDC050124]|uniref:glycoside hydrolase family 32 protein n=1 Tax=Kribbella sp. NPDC050124 TaxID=3364114 RepID=UPI0037B8E105
MRPRLHLTALEGWINDPLGLTFHNGQYHLFFQHVPGQTEWGPKCRWGHATSKDLLHWTQGPAVLAPGEGDDGCWSGSVVADPPTLFYTTVDSDDVRIGRVRIARPTSDDWTTWAKAEVVAVLPEGIEAIAYRDPFVFHDGDRWRMLMGGGLADGTATALIYTSDDLQQWAYDGDLASRHSSEDQPLWTGAVWECPQLFPLGDSWVLTVSVWEPFVPHYQAYAVGTYRDGRFVAEHWARLSYGPSYYAGSTFTDAHGRRGMIYWLRGVDDHRQGWAGANSIPHLLSLHDDTMVAEPHPNVTALRSAGTVVKSGEESVNLPSVADIEWSLDASTGSAGLTLADADGNIVLSLRTQDGVLDAITRDGNWSMPVGGNEIRLVVDGPIAELFSATGTMALPLSQVGGVALDVTGSGTATAYPLESSGD